MNFRADIPATLDPCGMPSTTHSLGFRLWGWLVAGFYVSSFLLVLSKTNLVYPSTHFQGMHGGISERIHNMEQLRRLRRPALDYDSRRPTLELDLLWADPEEGVVGTRPNVRGASVVFGTDVVARMCRQLDIDLIVRAHQV